MLHGEWALMNIIIMRGREASRPKQAFYLCISQGKSLYITLQICTCFIALTNEQPKKNWWGVSVRGQKRAKYQFVSKHSFLTSFYVHFVFKIHTIICSFCYTPKKLYFLKNLCEEWKEKSDRKWEEKRT